MRLAMSSVRALVLAVGAVALAACAGSGSSSGSGGDGAERPSLAGWDEGDPAQGNVQVTWKQLDPRHPAVTQTLVNESSEMGRRLRSGRASSAETKVISDEEMGRLLAALTEVGFYNVATRGQAVDTLPQVQGRRGAVVVSRDGESYALMLVPRMGSATAPTVYRDAKGLVLAVHGAAEGMEVRASTGDDAERVFSADPIRMKRP